MTKGNFTTNYSGKNARALGLIFAGLVFLFFCFNSQAVLTASKSQHLQISVSSSVPYAHCVDGVQNYDETGVDCGGSTCAACFNHCIDGIKNFDETGVDCGGSTCASCGGGGGGGGGGGTYISELIFDGKAAPSANVVILKDGILVGTAHADSGANFNFKLSNVIAGSYHYSVYFADTTGRQSAAKSIYITVYQGQSQTISGIILPPTIALDKEQIKREDWLDIFGQTIPNMPVPISVTPVDGGQTTLFNTTADSAGKYNLRYIAESIPLGDYQTKSQVKFGLLTSDYSLTKIFTIGTTTIAVKPETNCPQKGDVNGDCRVNLVDFSITAYWYKRSVSTEFMGIEALQLSDDGLINLVDFSILAYYWTG